jgi:hypothetical protein
VFLGQHSAWRHDFKVESILRSDRQYIELCRSTLHGAVSTWAADGRSACQFIPRLLWNPKVHYHVHKSSALYPVLSNGSLVQILTPTSRLILILSPIYIWVSQVVLSLHVPWQNVFFISRLPHVTISIWWTVHIVQFTPAPVISLLPVIKCPHLCSFTIVTCIF